MVTGFANPFPGLRPFEASEDHLFFGREQHVDQILRRLRTNRFVAVVGTSGCGKSSLIRCGLAPSLHGGQMVTAGSSWRIAIMRPGAQPFAQLAMALAEPEVLDAPGNPPIATAATVVEVALRRGQRGIIDSVQQARLQGADNVLVIIDQFEELFRFQRSRTDGKAREDAIAFVKLLLDASAQTDVPIYVVLTMRSDFIGECMEYPGLPEALNAGQYLVPRMTRDELRLAITGPVAVAGADIAPRLVQRLLNEVGSDQDQLPVLQHALMRTWDAWSARPEPRGPIDIADYDSVGGMRDALSRHAEEAFAEAGSGRGQLVAERVFCALTDLVADARGGRRPCTMSELTAVAAASHEEIRNIVDIFRRPGRSFLMPPAPVPLETTTVVDLAHESLMRCWTRLRDWAERERGAADVYLRLAQAAHWFGDGEAGLWRDPELGLALKWRAEHHPTSAWACRYDPAFDRALRFLTDSEAERDRLVAERRAERRRQWRRLQWLAGAFAALFVIVGVVALFATQARRQAQDERARAELNLKLAREAVDDSLASATPDPAVLAFDVPEVAGLRRQLLEKAQRFYQEFIAQSPQNEELQREIASARLKLGHLSLNLGARERAVTDYGAAVNAFSTLMREHPTTTEYRWSLVESYNWLGEALRRAGGRYANARSAYDAALDLGQPGAEAGTPEQRRLTARVRNNRGILLADHAGQDGVTHVDAEADLREAIRILEPLASSTSLQALQDLGRTYNNLGAVVSVDENRAVEARDLYARAVQLHEGLTLREPRNREYTIELVQFYNNLSEAHRMLSEIDQASQRNAQALERIEVLGRPAPPVGIERADGYNLRGRIAQSRAIDEAILPYRRSIELFRALGQDEDTRRLAEFHERFADLLLNLADAAAGPNRAGRTLFDEGLRAYLAVAEQVRDSNSPVDARRVVDAMSRVRSGLDNASAVRVDTLWGAVRRTLEPLAGTAAGTPP